MRGALLERYRALRAEGHDPVEAWAALQDDAEARADYVSARGKGGLVRATWQEAADLIVKGLEGAIKAKTVTYAFARQMAGATLRQCSEFAVDLVQWMG